MPKPELTWITEKLAIAIHKRQLAEHGGIEGVRDSGLLSSALARPQNLLTYSQKQPEIATLAAAYGYGIANNHPFNDGNKRTAFVVTRTFLILNGYDIQATQEEKYITYYQLAAGQFTEDELIAWINDHLEKQT